MPLYHANRSRRGPLNTVRTLLALLVLAPAAAFAAETSYVTVENRSAEIAKIALPGARPKRVKPGAEALKIELEVTLPNGVDAKAWWVSNPRQLCVIFVRYQGHVVIAGDKDIRCLGH